MESTMLQPEEKRSHHHSQASPLDAAGMDTGATDEQVHESPIHEVKSCPQAVDVDAALPAPLGPLGNKVEAEAKESVLVKFDPESESSQPSITCVQLADRVLNHSFIEDLSKHISAQAVRSFLETYCNNLQQLPSNGTGRKTTEVVSRKSQASSRGRGEGLPEELVEKILSRIPFPSLFKLQILSRPWFYKFPLQSVKSLDPTFQNLVSSVSSQWPTYCPVYFTPKEILCFDRASFRWRSIIPLSYTSGPCLFPRRGFSCRITTAGPLVCLVSCFPRPVRTSLAVTNVITKGCRKLPKSPNEHGEPSSLIRIIQTSSDHYKVILVYPSDGETLVFNSNLHEWTFKTFLPHSGDFFPHSAYLDKNLYCLFKDGDTLVLTLWRYEVEDDAWLLPTPLSLRLEQIRDSAILVCEDRVMATVWFGENDEDVVSTSIEGVTDKIQIFELNLSTLKLIEVCRGPPDSISNLAFRESETLNKECYKIDFASDSNFIYLGLYGEQLGHCDDGYLGRREFPVITYNIHSHVWSCLPKSPLHYRMYDAPWVGLAFQPGLNPFISV